MLLREMEMKTRDESGMMMEEEILTVNIKIIKTDEGIDFNSLDACLYGYY